MFSGFIQISSTFNLRTERWLNNLRPLTLMSQPEVYSDEGLNSLLELHNAYNIKPLVERISTNRCITHGHAKHPDTNGPDTGEAMMINKIPNLAIVDIDMNKSFTDDEKTAVRNDLIKLLHPEDVVVKTGNGGLHIYCNMDAFTLPVNENCRIIVTDNFGVDILLCVKPDKRQLVMMAGSRTRNNLKAPKKTRRAVPETTEEDEKKTLNPILHYEWIQGSYDSVVTRSINQVLHDLHLSIKTERHQSLDVISIMKDTVEGDIGDELSEALIGGISGFTIHNDAGGIPIKEEITLFTLFQALNSLPEAYIKRAYDAALQNCTLTPKARQNWTLAQNRYSQMHTCPFVLAKMIRYHNPDYYTAKLRPILNSTHTSIISDIDVNLEFDLTKMIANAEQGMYKNEKEVIIDLSKFVRRINSTSILYIEKVYNPLFKTYVLVYNDDGTMKRKLKSIKLWKEGAKQITAWTVLDDNSSKLTSRGVVFNSTDPDLYSMFRGFKYSNTLTPDTSIISKFLEFIKDVIADNNEEINEYILNWISILVQNPGFKTGTALILKGHQGVGKGTFTDVLCEMLSPYSAQNVTDMAELTGSFNSIVEGRTLIVLNEVKNAGADKYANFDALKSIITDGTIRINEKCQPRHTAENVANFIFCTNNAFPVRMNADDRRYVVTNVEGKHRGDFKYWSELRALIYKQDRNPRPEFFDNLTSYFAHRDISDFKVQVIPKSMHKDSIIEASRSSLEMWINEHYDELITGIHIRKATDERPSDIKYKQFDLQLLQYCNKERKGKSRLTYYILKEDCYNLFHQIHDEDDYFEEEEEEEEEDTPTETKPEVAISESPQ